MSSFSWVAGSILTLNQSASSVIRGFLIKPMDECCKVLVITKVLVRHSLYMVSAVSVLYLYRCVTIGQEHQFHIVADHFDLSFPIFAMFES
jgi:hypothetical protein